MLARSERGSAVRLITCRRARYTNVGTGVRPITSIRPPTSGNPCAARSTTRGDCGSLPLNHGLTVWRSDDATSTVWLAIRARMWLATRSSGIGSRPGGPSATKAAMLPAAKAAAVEAAIAAQPARQLIAKGRPRQCGNAATQRRARRLPRQAFPQGVAERLNAPVLFCECVVLGQSLLKFERMRRIKLAVDIGVEQQPIVLRHRHLSAPSISISRRRARARRDITVPIGTPVIAAISL